MLFDFSKDDIFWYQGDVVEMVMQNFIVVVDGEWDGLVGMVEVQVFQGVVGKDGVSGDDQFYEVGIFFVQEVIIYFQCVIGYNFYLFFECFDFGYIIVDFEQVVCFQCEIIGWECEVLFIVDYFDDVYFQFFYQGGVYNVLFGKFIVFQQLQFGKVVVQFKVFGEVFFLLFRQQFVFNEYYVGYVGQYEWYFYCFQLEYFKCWQFFLFGDIIDQYVGGSIDKSVYFVYD